MAWTIRAPPTPGRRCDYCSAPSSSSTPLPSTIASPATSARLLGVLGIGSKQALPSDGTMEPTGRSLLSLSILVLTLDRREPHSESAPSATKVTWWAALLAVSASLSPCCFLRRARWRAAGKSPGRPMPYQRSKECAPPALTLLARDAGPRGGGTGWRWWLGKERGGGRGGTVGALLVTEAA